MGTGAEEDLWGALYFLLSFAMNPKLPFKKCPLEMKPSERIHDSPASYYFQKALEGLVLYGYNNLSRAWISAGLPQSLIGTPFLLHAFNQTPEE